jgi:hypothetical protein
LKQNDFEIVNSLPDKELKRIIMRFAPLGETVKKFMSNDNNTMITKSYVGNLNQL